MVTLLGPICNTHAPSTLVVPDIHRTRAFIPGETRVGFVLVFVVFFSFLLFFSEEPHDDPGINKVENADREKESRGGGPEPDPQTVGLSARCIFKLKSVPGQDP